MADNAQQALFVRYWSTLHLALPATWSITSHGPTTKCINILICPCPAYWTGNNRRILWSYSWFCCYTLLLFDYRPVSTNKLWTMFSTWSPHKKQKIRNNWVQKQLGQSLKEAEETVSVSSLECVVCAHNEIILQAMLPWNVQQQFSDQPLAWWKGKSWWQGWRTEPWIMLMMTMKSINGIHPGIPPLTPVNQVSLAKISLAFELNNQLAIWQLQVVVGRVHSHSVDWSVTWLMA